MNIKRYVLTIATTGKDDPDGEYTFVQGVGHSDGDWVKWSEVEKLLTLIKALDAERQVVIDEMAYKGQCFTAEGFGRVRKAVEATDAARRAASGEHKG